jgi:diaminopimelate epimerase
MQEEAIPFIKMQGAGNDFVVIDNRDGQFTREILIELAPKLCNRRYGVGADGLMALNAPDQPDLDFTMIYRNADGSDAGMCGNGARCLALYAHRLGMGKTLKFSVHNQIYLAEIDDLSRVLVSFPGEVTVTELEDDDDSILYQVYTGTEHIVRKVAEPTLKNEKQLVIEGQRIRKLERFKPEGTNVNFMCCLSEGELTIQTYERGVEGLTYACGTGAIASAIAWHHLQQSGTIRNTYNVHTKGGILKVHFSYTPQTAIFTDLKLEGPAHFVFEGRYFD